jgi:acetyltransferase-like isoleucine patch superfamily enzyme|tara:strand:+ start:914 stop:1489 length:576 start_codon:yes stop_codon:yes gene_type:complete
LYQYYVIYRFLNARISFSAKIGAIGNVKIGLGTVIQENVQINTSCISGLPSYKWQSDGRVSIGNGCKVRSGSILACAGDNQIVIGDNVDINSYCIIYGNVVIGSDTLIAAHTVIVPNNHSFSERDEPIRTQPMRSKGVVIGEDVWIGTHVTILDGVEIGKGAVIGASSVVTKSIPEYAIAVGNPARVIRER